MRNTHSPSDPKRAASRGDAAAAHFLCVLLGALIILSACATNPVSGRRELSLVSSSQEIAMGREGAEEVARSIGIYPDGALQGYVANIGKRMAANSERPDLPWSFAVVDDPSVNAFALPGGYIFVTRGMLAHMNSEAQLAAVLGHEIGHVTAKHSVSQISRAQLTQLGLGVGYVLSEDLRRIGGLADTGIGLLFLKFGRDDENQSDELGFRYALASGYDPREMVPVFETLDRVSASSGAERLPQWMSTHPNPGNRVARTEERLRNASHPASGLRVGRDDYLGYLDGLTFGADPRLGYFKGSAFYHPKMAFRLTFPDGWKTNNGVNAVVGVSPQEDAAIELSLAGDEPPAAAVAKFLTREGMAAGSTSTAAINDLSAAMAPFSYTSSQGVLAGRVAFIALDGKTFRILAYGSEQGEERNRKAMHVTLTSFRRLTDRGALAVQPATLELITIDRAMTMEEFNQRYPSTVPLETVALLNGRLEVERVPKGTRLKRVKGGTLPG
jgi:predicted Zn-dependent protease